MNENPYGNGVALFTRDGGVARQFQFDVNVGHGRDQRPDPVPVAYYSFGGWKSSLFGDRHIYGPEGIDFYTRTKAVTSRWPDPATSRSTSASRRRASGMPYIRLVDESDATACSARSTTPRSGGRERSSTSSRR